MKLEKARSLAEKVVTALAPHCRKIAIAGSIRRERLEVNDIDLVLIPHNLGAVLERVSQSCTIVSGGLNSVNITARISNGFQLDLWLAHNGERDMFNPTPSNWGSVLLCRTGSMAHNINLCGQAKGKGLHWDTYRGLIQADKVIAAATEEEIYAALGMEFRPPTERG